ncbi:MAG: methyltransferase domain-containing protein [Chloroflexi bacterium]|nr:methyltransferase domain-containing protein [Chloroflexota bacterium]
MDDRDRWNERYRAGRGPRFVNPRLQQYLPLLRRGRVLDLACGRGQNAQVFAGATVIQVDLSEEALAQAGGLRVQADAQALPFAACAFDTIVCTYFFDPRVDFAGLLKPGGTLFFETYTVADVKYRPSFNPAYLLDPAQAPLLFKGLETLCWLETDDDSRVFGTYIGRKPLTGDHA